MMYDPSVSYFPCLAKIDSVTISRTFVDVSLVCDSNMPAKDIRNCTPVGAIDSSLTAVVDDSISISGSLRGDYSVKMMTRTDPASWSL